MKTKININVNGKNFEALVDTSLLLGMMGPEKFNKVNVPMPVSLPRENPIETLNEGLENSPFWLEEVTKINRAIMALHQRLKRLEETVWSPRPKHIEMPLFSPSTMNEFMKVASRNIKQVLEQAKITEEPKKPIANKLATAKKPSNPTKAKKLIKK